MENLLKTSQLLVKLSALGLLDTTFKTLSKVRKTPLPTTKLTKIPTVKNTSQGIAPAMSAEIETAVANPVSKLPSGGINAY